MRKKLGGRPKGSGTGKARELTPAEIERLTATTTNPRDVALIWLCLGAGLRVGEACTMTVGRLGSDGSVLVERSRSKSGKSRRCYLAPRALGYLRTYLATRPTANDTDPLFPLRTGKRDWMTPNWGARLVKGLMEAAAIDGASSHSLRRSHANTLRRQGVDVLIIQGQLGHAHLNTTARYLHASDAERAAALTEIKF